MSEKGEVMYWRYIEEPDLYDHDVDKGDEERNEKAANKEDTDD